MEKIISFVVIIFFAFSNCYQVTAADLDKGIFELNRGEFKKAIDEFEPLLLEGYAPAQYQMALIYQNGWGKNKDQSKAFELMSLAAEQNYSDALFSLSVMYTDGDVVKKDLTKAFVLMEKAAQKELASAQFNVAVMYANAQGTTKNMKKAAKWYEKAANQNYVLAQFNLALLYFEGTGVNKDLNQSHIWNYIAAKSGYVPAKKSRDMDEHRLSVKQVNKNREKADELHARIIERRDRKAKAIKAANQPIF